MNWRGNPVTKARPPDNNNWPRNGSILKGIPETLPSGEKWLHCTEIKQAGSDEFLKLKQGYWMPWENSGPLLREDL